jgi:glycosyltransferase involved in cell wall biosynthesis
MPILAELLVPSLVECESIILPLIKVIQAKRIVQIGGSKLGQLTEKLLPIVEAAKGELIRIDPHAYDPLLKKLIDTSPNAKLFFDFTKNVLPSLPAADLYIINSDPNYYTIKEELENLWKHQNKASHSFFAVIHGTGWPFARRDGYTNPDLIPKNYLHAHTWTEGIVPDDPGTGPLGFRLPAIAFAKQEGGPSNGILIAIHEFMKDKKECLNFIHLPGFFGLGFLYSRQAAWSPEITELLKKHTDVPLLDIMEEIRLETAVEAATVKSELIRQEMHRQNRPFDMESFCQKVNQGLTEKENLGLVSIIIPTYNRPELLAEAIKSAAEQTYKDIEIVVINDSGKDVSNVIHAFSDPRIVYISHETNKGLPAARNTAIQHSKGDWIAYLDDDDIYCQRHIEILLNALKQSDFKVAYADFFRVYKRQMNGKLVACRKALDDLVSLDLESVLIRTTLPPVAVMHSKCCFDQIGFFDETLSRYEDWDLWIRLAVHYPFLHIPIPTSEYTKTEGYAQMVTGWAGFFLNSLLILHARYKSLSENKPALQALQAEFRTKYRYWAYSQLEIMDNSELQCLKIEATMREIIHNSLQLTAEDVRGAYALLDYLVQRMPDNEALVDIKKLMS